MSSPRAEALTSRQRAAFDFLLSDIDRIFGTRVRSVVAYGFDDGDGDDLRALTIVDALSPDDLHRLAPLAREWKKRQLAVPLFLTHHELARTLDVFPLEYGDIIARHVCLRGDDPFAGLQVAADDRRRGCERAAKSHLIHLREGFIETEGDPTRIARLISASAPPFRSLLQHIVRLERGDAAGQDLDDHALADAVEASVGVPAALVADVLSQDASRGIADPSPLLARYVAASERLWRFVDGWRS